MSRDGFCVTPPQRHRLRRSAGTETQATTRSALERVILRPLTSTLDGIDPPRRFYRGFGK